ncbi:MAG: TolC family protein [Bryobacterales bacterium]|nr:TolC family protein [Bryobacterales bacterium]
MILTPFLAAAQQQAPLSLDDCVRLAMAAQSAASLARQEGEIARLGLAQAKAAFLPQGRILSGYTYNTPSRTDPGVQTFVALNGSREYIGLATIGAELDTSGRLRAGLARARADQDLAAAGLQVTQRDLRRQVTVAYLRLLLTRRLARVANETLAEARNFEKRVRLLAAGGEAAQADVYRASAEAAFLDQARSGAELEAETANHDLAAFWTAETATPLPLVDVFDAAIPAPEATGNAPSPYLRRPEFRIFDAEKRGFLAEYRRTRADLYPQLGVVYQYGLDANQVRASNRGQAAFVNLNIPIFDWFKTRGAARQFQLRSAQSDTRRQIAERAFSSEYQSALSRVKRIYQQIAITEGQVRFSEENLRLSRIRYEGGEGLALEVVSAQTQLGQARSNYYTTVANYLSARVDLEVAEGR